MSLSLSYILKFWKSNLPTQAFATQICDFHTELADVSRLRTLTWESRIALYIYSDATRRLNYFAGDVAMGVRVITPGLVGNIWRLLKTIKTLWTDVLNHIITVTGNTTVFRYWTSSLSDLPDAATGFTFGLIRTRFRMTVEVPRVSVFVLPVDCVVLPQFQLQVSQVQNLADHRNPMIYR